VKRELPLLAKKTYPERKGKKKEAQDSQEKCLERGLKIEIQLGEHWAVSLKKHFPGERGGLQKRAQ